MTSKRLILAAVGFAVLCLASCKKDDPVPVTIQASTVSNLPADPPTGGIDPISGQPTGFTRKYTFFSFKTGAIVANADSATNKWDLGFNGTTIIVNNTTSGPGTASVQVVSGIFDELLTAPETGYKTDDRTVVPTAYAIPKGTGNGWYNYDGATNVITPLAGRVIVVKTSEGKYAKMEILSYYKDAPTSPTSASPERYYTFRYVYQSGTGTSFK